MLISPNMQPSSYFSGFHPPGDGRPFIGCVHYEISLVIAAGTAVEVGNTDERWLDDLNAKRRLSRVVDKGRPKLHAPWPAGRSDAQARLFKRTCGQ
jgi:hypothetical protein